MKLFFILASLFSAARASFGVGTPEPGTIIQPGQKFDVQIQIPLDLVASTEGGEVEISLVIGIVNCVANLCPAPSSDLGEVLFLGRYEMQGVNNDTLTGFENFTFVVPSDISGPAAIQIQHNYALTQQGHSFPIVEYGSIAVQAGSASSAILNIHPPDNSTTKCVGILGGVYTNGAAVDIFDCNGSATQKWQWNGGALTSIDPVDGSQWCLDAGVQSSWSNGAKMKIWQCFSNLPQQTWIPLADAGTIPLATADFCLDLPNGSVTNQNILQIWTCDVITPGQVWTVTAISS